MIKTKNINKNESYKEANEIYETGISRGAQPLERLNKRYKQFLTRMTLMDVNLNTNTVAIPTPPIPQQLNLNSRTILGSKSSSSSTRSQPMNVFHQRNPTSYTVSDIENASSQISTSDNNEKLNIFYDPNGEIGNSALSSTNSKTSIWNSYGTYLSRKKEDIQEAEQWKGVTLPQNKKVHAPMAAKLEIYHDKVYRKIIRQYLVLLILRLYWFFFSQLNVVQIRQQIFVKLLNKLKYSH